MMNRHIAKLEARLERLVEGAFSSLLGKRLRVQDIALQLMREMELRAKASPEGADAVVPNHYIVLLNARIYEKLRAQTPDIQQALVQYVVDIAASNRYRFLHTPEVTIQGDAELAVGDIRIIAQETTEAQEHTAVMERVAVEEERTEAAANNPQLLLDGEKPILLRKSIINIGRGRDNDIVLDDPYVSRHHVQLRLRFGVYTLFDTNSRSGTWVNDVRVQEQALKSGDVIRIGQTKLIYLDDGENHGGFTSATQSMNPIR